MTYRPLSTSASSGAVSLYGPRLSIYENSDSNLDEDQRIFSRLLEQVSRSGELYRELLRRDRFEVVPLMDIAPTLLTLLKAPVPEAMQGKVQRVMVEA